MTINEPSKTSHIHDRWFQRMCRITALIMFVVDIAVLELRHPHGITLMLLFSSMIFAIVAVMTGRWSR